jgi:hypothetical protein
MGLTPTSSLQPSCHPVRHPTSHCFHPLVRPGARVVYRFSAETERQRTDVTVICTVFVGLPWSSHTEGVKT